MLEVMVVARRCMVLFTVAVTSDGRGSRVVLAADGGSRGGVFFGGGEEEDEYVFICR
jgi:hypothetical protein